MLVSLEHFLDAPVESFIENSLIENQKNTAGLNNDHTVKNRCFWESERYKCNSLQQFEEKQRK